ncbi:solute carrier family 25 member 45 isoform X1 [Cynoglossus semilaevis]|uniref:solute carrier family 25 member 45 isoform X1 n=1 Tax=Cynoglossus semilaevis TaxID=244447 RepID=UPI0004959E3F|nr:solute carrier family 25 member 45 isoform X1 [Cynoglossus semilaevis]
MPFLEFFAGTISGALGVAVGYPLDTVKVRLQTQSVYKGIFHCVAKTYRHEGFHGFFKGMAFPVMTTGVINSILFGSYSYALHYLTQGWDKSKKASNAQVLAAGCFSGLMQVFASLPTDLVKVRLQGQTSSERYRGPVHCVAVILKGEGVRGLYRGGVPYILRDVPCFGLYFLPYEFTRKALTATGKDSDTFAVLVAGGVAGVTSWCLATPMDVIKSRLQMSGAGGPEYRGFLHCIRVSVREEGVRVLFKGLLLNSLRAFPVNAVTFLSYESLMKFFSVHL